MILTPPPDSNSSQKLVVFLPGTGASPDKFDKLLKAAQLEGHFVIGLSYLSQPFPVSKNNAWCTSDRVMNPGDCNAELHELILFGVAPQRLQGASKDIWSVRPAYSIISLLKSTLQALGWGKKFLKYDHETESDEVDWEKIIISGHSQGAGHAAYLSYKKLVPAVLFSGPQDCGICSREWLQKMSFQNVTRRALFHENEECGPHPLNPKSYCEKDLMLQNLSLMGMKGFAFKWLNNNSIPEKTNTIISTAPSTCSEGRSYHNSVAQDKCASRNIEYVWSIMFSNIE